ncbi:MAG: NhaP-type Na+/H+ or K+/H+ antiporter [Acidimicrobiales bacterium]
MSAVEVCIFLAGLIGYSLVSRRTEAWPLTMPMVFVTFGVLTDATDFIDLRIEEEGVALLGEVALAVLLFSDAVRLDTMRLRREALLPIRLLAIGLPLSIALGAVGIALLLPSLSIWEAALIAAILAPTDAALGQAVIEDERVPAPIRQGLNVESGLNDGVALPAVLLFAALASGEDAAAGFWITFVLRQVGGGLLVGLAVGLGGGWLLRHSLRANWIEGIFAQLATLGLALLALSGAVAVGANGFIAAFVAGLSFGAIGNTAVMLDEYAEDTGRLLSLVMFFVFGNIFVRPAFAAISLVVVVCVLGSLTIGRVLPVLIALAPGRPNWRTVAFVGWFGPRGLASILFGLVLVEEKLSGADDLFAIISLTVLASVFLHGATATWGAGWYGDWWNRALTDRERLHVRDDAG